MIVQGNYKEEGLQIPLESWESRHLLYTWFAVTCTIFAALWQSRENWMFVAFVYSFLCGGALCLSKFFRILIYDSLLQFQYREKFGLFVFHLVALAVPWMMGFSGWNHAIAALLVVLCGQAVHVLGAGRIYAFTTLLGVIALLAPPFPPFFLTAGWMFFLLMAMRAEHVRFRLERFGTRQSLPHREAIRAIVRTITLPWLFAIIPYGIGWYYFHGRERRLHFEAGVIRGGPSSELGAVSMSEVVWDGIILAGLIIATLLVLHWLERKLRGQQKASVQQGEATLGVSEEFDRLAPRIEQLEIEQAAHDPRGRILARFRKFSRNLELTGWGRRENETAREFFSRLGALMNNPEEIPTPLSVKFNRACYSREEVSESEAVEFLIQIEQVEPLLRERIAAEAKKESDQAAPPGQ